MIDYENKEVVINGIRGLIEKWEVQFSTPFGICKTLDEAIEVCKKNDLLPALCIRPIPLVHGAGSYEPILGS